MLNQSFDNNTLLKITRRQEIINFSLGRCKADYSKSLLQIAELINSESFSFHSLSSFNFNDKKIYKIDSPEEWYALKKISYNLKKLYRIKFSSKDEITSQIINIITDPSPFRIFRLDVKDFFESIDLADVIKKIKNDNLLSFSNVRILDVLQNTEELKDSGLPRGLSISSVMSEIYMSEIDKEIRYLPQIYYYARYVDDIIIITHNNLYKIEDFEKIFSRKKMQLNKKSKCIITSNPESQQNKSNKLDFLGYSYLIHDALTKNNVRDVSINPSDKKIKKIKSRIIKSLISFAYKKDKELILNRIRFLTGNYYLDNEIILSKKFEFDSSDQNKLKGGIYYNNKHINDNIKLYELNSFLRSLLYCKRDNFIGRVVKEIPPSLCREISSYNFAFGFEKKIIHSFTESEIKKICECWM